MPESIGCNEGVGGEDDREQADYGEGGEEGSCDCGDCSLHQFAVGVVSRGKSYWGKYCEKECQWKVILFSAHCFLEENQKVAQDNDDNNGCWADDIVAQEAGAHCHCNGSEDQVGGEEEGSLDCFNKSGLVVKVICFGSHPPV